MLGQIINNYADKTELQQSSELICQFIRKSQEPFSTQDSALNQACLITDTAIKRFLMLDKQAKKSILKIVQLTLDYPINKCFDITTKNHYVHIIRIIIDSEVLDQKLRILLSFLNCLDSFSYKELSSACLAATFASRYFDYLLQINKEQILRLYQLAKLKPLSQLETLAESKEFYENIREIFKNFKCAQLDPDLDPDSLSSPTTQSSLEKPPLVWNEYQNVKKTTEQKKSSSFKQIFRKQSNPSKAKEPLTESSFGDKHSYPPLTLLDEKMIEKNEGELSAKQQQQLAKMKSLCQDILLHYSSLIFKIPSASFCDLSLKKFSNRFSENFSILLPYLFPALKVFAFSTQEQNLITSLLKQISLFLNHVNTGVLKKENLKPEALQVTINELCEEISNLILNIFGNNPTLSPSQAFLPHVLTFFITYFLNRLSNPYSIYLILERLIDDSLLIKLASEELYEKKPALGAFPLNVEFSKKLGNIFSDMGNELIKMGDPKGAAQVATKACLLLLEKNKEVMGDKLQQFISQIRCSSSRLTFLLVFHHFLFYLDEENHLKPTFTTLSSPDVKEILRIQEALKKKISEKFYPLILDSIKKQSTLGAWMTNQSTTIKDFYDHFLEGIWRVIQQEELLHALSLYLLQGFKQGLLTSK
jgi:hypothetical protein